jgi:hypothetical protein
MEILFFALGVIIGVIAMTKLKSTVSKVKSPPRKREIGDIVMQRKSKLPIVLLEELSYGKFRGCYITPMAKALGATVGQPPKGVDASETFILINVNSTTPDWWPDYTDPLSDEEHRNYAAAMLKSAK